MAAGQQKKRLHASVVSCDLQERSDTKKKKNVVSPHTFLNMKAHISLEWDERQQKVVAKREQIGIAWRKLGPFINPLPPRHNALADVLSIPQEAFVLEDMTGVLSYEVWETQLSETEKTFLTQFLPKGADAEQVVHALLMGENLHFGNLFLKWGASLCSGKLHPDAILCQEQRVAAYKKAYDLELEKYHSEYLTENMVESLQKLKETWMNCEGPEKDIVEKMWRKEYADKRGTVSNASERPNVVVSSSKEEKPQRLYVRSGDGAKYMSYFKITRKQHQLVKGIKQPDGIKSKCLNHVLGDIRSFQVQPYELYEEEERKKLHEHWLGLVNRDLPSAFTNWTENLLQRKHWRRSLEHEMKENKKSAYEDEKGTLRSLLQEQVDIGDTDEAVKDTHNFEDEEESSPQSSDSTAVEQISSLNCHHELELVNSELEEGSEDIFETDCPASVLSELEGNTSTRPRQRIPFHNGLHKIELMNTDSDESSQDVASVPPKFVRDRNPQEVSGQNAPLFSAIGSVSYSTGSQPLHRVPSLNRHHELDTLDMELGESSLDITKPDGSTPTVSQFAGSINPTKNAAEHEVCLSSAKDAWMEVGLPDSYYHHTPANHGYSSSGELSLGQPHYNRERPANLIDLETDIISGEAKETFIHKPSNDLRPGFESETGGSFSGSYTIEDCNELFQPFLKRQERVPSQANDQKQVRLQFLGGQNVLLGAGHHPGHLHKQQQQQQLLEQRQQVRDRDYYMHRVIQKNIYTNSGRYPCPSQELFSPVNMGNWTVDTIQESTPLREALSVDRELLSENTSPAEHHQSRGGWSRVDVSSSSQGLGNGSSADGSLLSVLSQYNKSQPTYNSIGTCEGGGMGASIGSNGDFFPHAGNQVLSGRDAGTGAATMKTNNMSWMNLAHENSGRHDSIGKSLLRSWNL